MVNNTSSVNISRPLKRFETMPRTIFALLLVVSLAWTNVEAFLVAPQPLAKTNSRPKSYNYNNLVTNPITPTGSPLVRETPSALSMSQYDGTGRGVPILAAALLVCVWFFTIPPEFRRAYICSERCEANREAVQCNECMTGEEFVNGIKEYYRNGGGIQWDFSIDPKSKMKTMF